MISLQKAGYAGLARVYICDRCAKGSVRQVKGVFDMFDPVLVAPFEQYRDDIKAGRGVVLAVPAKPSEGGLADLPLFERGDGKLRDAVGKGFAALDLYEDQGIAIPGHDVDLATLAAEIPFDDLEAASLQEGSCQLFAAIAEPGVLMAFAIFPSHGST